MLTGGDAACLSCLAWIQCSKPPAPMAGWAATGSVLTAITPGAGGPAASLPKVVRGHDKRKCGAASARSALDIKRIVIVPTLVTVWARSVRCAKLLLVFPHGDGGPWSKFPVTEGEFIQARRNERFIFRASIGLGICLEGTSEPSQP